MSAHHRLLFICIVLQYYYDRLTLCMNWKLTDGTIKTTKATTNCINYKCMILHFYMNSDHLSLVKLTRLQKLIQ